MVPLNNIKQEKDNASNEPERCKYRADDVIVLLGAGASVEAGLLSSEAMTKQLESNIASKDEKIARKWKKYDKLYRAVKSAILYGHHLTASDNDETITSVNIEELVNVLTELAKAESHTIYPFIAAWNMELTKYGGADFSNLKEFRRDIVNELVGSWVNVKNVEDCQYYRNFIKFWDETRSCLRIFSLNYDMCVERACGIEKICRGFRLTPKANGEMWKTWKDGQMDDGIAEQSSIILYKLHGSLDWRREKKSRILYCEDSPDPCADIDDYQLIFGTKYKLSYRDPFLYQISELRKYVAKARLIIAIGYGFNDEHINEILGKVLTQKIDSKLISVDYIENFDSFKIDEKKKNLKKKLDVDESVLPRIVLTGEGAKKFLENDFNRAYVESMLEDDESVF